MAAALWRPSATLSLPVLSWRRSCSGEIEDDAALDAAGFQAGEVVVDVAERRAGDVGAHFAPIGDGDGFVEVAAGADDRAAEGDAFQRARRPVVTLPPRSAWKRFLLLFFKTEGLASFSAFSETCDFAERRSWVTEANGIAGV